jgi:hypothetical protein
MPKVSELGLLTQVQHDDLLYVVHDPSGTARSRALMIEALRGVIDVRDYGATGDGSTDDTAAIQAAIDRAADLYSATAGRTTPVCIPHGTYMVSNITLPHHTHIIGGSMTAPMLKMISGSTGILLTDEGTAVDIIIVNLELNGNGNTCNGLVLGFGDIQHGSGGYVHNVLIRNCDGDGVTTGFGFRINGNAAWYSQIDCSGGSITKAESYPVKMYCAGSANVWEGLVHYGNTDCAIDIQSTNDDFYATHLEGWYSTAGIVLNNRMNRVFGVRQTVRENETLPCVIYIQRNMWPNQIWGVGALLESYGDPEAAVLTNVIYDKAWSGVEPDMREVYGEIGLDARYRYVDFYRAGPHPYSRDGTSSWPADGQAFKGDRYWFTSVDPGEPFLGGCIVSGSPGTWAPLITAPGAIAKTADYPIVAEDKGKRFCNANASGIITLTLPAGTVGMRYHFTRRNTTYAMRIDPNGSETLEPGGAGKYTSLDTDGASISCECISTGIWVVTAESGTNSQEA